jgi:hypothetical protein
MAKADIRKIWSGEKGGSEFQERIDDRRKEKKEWTEWRKQREVSI